ncbi:FdhF/YdeP family oxidoreductase [Sandaracinobacteroides saxicola]|uniref:FdhF/YdeP family oxidoreductase n=1 Tax=Sandaracinobacteroides saxicola TaxID=2759707 RepID=A0A7G5IGJ6_9SPHN|nr:FdhF/YdeP family oxidoreductase [Sandaracinobacteroides saxicola]QMW22488.1 FdhF/YdeP family oxidoreductase [Sandaracinobacteroides saxicola]
MSDTPIGGGLPKIAYAARTVAKIGVGQSAKALTARNTCKACGLGMGGQKGGMTNEAGEFPSVCNKSIQAQSTDIQPAIPLARLTAPLATLRALDGHDLDHLGRLDTPLYRAAGATAFVRLGWEEALTHAAHRMTEATPPRSFFYSSGRSSNEAGFLLQLLARAWGTNNINNCSYYCHQATSVGLGSTIGTGTATVELGDLDKCDFLLLLGANPASNHPRFIHKLAACRARGGQVVVVNPAKEPGLVKFALPKSARSLLKGGDAIASDWLQPRIGGDIALLKALAKALIEQGATDPAFIAAHTNGYDAFALDLAALDWPVLEAASGCIRADITRVAALHANARNAVFAWGMGLTHHLHGSANVEMVANLALLRGMVGRPGAGLLPLRGHSNVQGIGTIGVKPVLAADVMQALEKHVGVKLPSTPGMDTMAAMHAAHDGRIGAAVIMGGNLYEATPNHEFARQAMERIGFKLFLTTTINRGHIVDDGETLILPVTARDEEWQPTTQESMFNYVRLSDGGIERHGNVRPESHILADLASRLMPAGPIDFQAFKAHRKLRETIAATIPGMAALADIDVAKREFHVTNRLLHHPNFQTADGRATFALCPLPSPSGEGRLAQRAGVGPGPEVGQGAIPLTLATIRSEGQFNSIIYERTDSYRGHAPRNALLMHPTDIAAHGLTPGSTVTLASPHGRLPGLVIHPFDVHPGNVLAYYPEANALTATTTDPRSKTPAFKSVPVWIEQ